MIGKCDGKISVSEAEGKSAGLALSRYPEVNNLRHGENGQKIVFALFPNNS
jgi:hypothetical protein